MNRHVVFLIALALGIAPAGCTRTREPATDVSTLLRFDTSRVMVITETDTLRLLVELAQTPEQQTMGLMERPRLADSAGMLFVYSADQPETAGFWMFRTRIPLDIAFIDSLGTIRSIRRMVPCEAATVERCPTYSPGTAYRTALEVNAGYFDRHKVVVGHRVVLPGS